MNVFAAVVLVVIVDTAGQCRSRAAVVSDCAMLTLNPPTAAGGDGIGRGVAHLSRLHRPPWYEPLSAKSPRPAGAGDAVGADDGLPVEATSSTQTSRPDLNPPGPVTITSPAADGGRIDREFIGVGHGERGTPHRSRR
jgi:hypothetical protein